MPVKNKNSIMPKKKMVMTLRENKFPIEFEYMVNDTGKGYTATGVKSNEIYYLEPASYPESRERPDLEFYYEKSKKIAEEDAAKRAIARESARIKGFRIFIAGIDDLETSEVYSVSDIKFENVYSGIVEGGISGVEKSFKQRMVMPSFTFTIPVHYTCRGRLKEWINDKNDKHKCLYYTIYTPNEITYTFYGVSVKRIDYVLIGLVYYNSITIQAQRLDMNYGKDYEKNRSEFKEVKQRQGLISEGLINDIEKGELEGLAYIDDISYPDKASPTGSYYEDSGIIKWPHDEYLIIDPKGTHSTRFASFLKYFSPLGKFLHSVIWDYADWAIEKFWIDRPYEKEIENIDKAEEKEIENIDKAEEEEKKAIDDELAAEKQKIIEENLTPEEEKAKIDALEAEYDTKKADAEKKYKDQRDEVEKKYKDQRDEAEEKHEKAKKIYKHVDMTAVSFVKNGSFSLCTYINDSAEKSFKNMDKKDKKGKK